MYAEKPLARDANIMSIFNITWESTSDGPGRRLVLFLQGCPLDCKWCHSPHSKADVSPLLYFDGLCASCMRCVDACPNNVHSFDDGRHIVDRAHCQRCGACIEACPQSSSIQHSGALVLPTRNISIDALFELIRPQLELLKDSGGITISGGEPLMQADAVTLLAQRCHEQNINVALETSGIVTVKEIEKVAPYVDTWLIGMRLTTGHRHTVSPTLEKRTRHTIEWLRKNSHANIIVRIPVIPDYTSTDDYLKSADKILADYSLTHVEVLHQNPEQEHYYKASGISSMMSYSQRQADSSYNEVSAHFANSHQNDNV